MAISFETRKNGRQTALIGLRRTLCEATQQIAQPGPLRFRRIRPVVAAVERAKHQLDRAELEARAGRKRALARDARAVDKRAVRRAKIDDEPARAFAQQRRVIGGDAFIANAYVALRTAPDRADRTVDRERCARIPSTHDLETRGARSVRVIALAVCRILASQVREIEQRRRCRVRAWCRDRGAIQFETQMFFVEMHHVAVPEQVCAGDAYAVDDRSVRALVAQQISVL